ncbi:MAG: T9SS type A sorting domain-containing protein [Cytophagales bacterium]|nr:T9SS type A sorting domain-containing protein [Cytophagales bacterium]
MKKLVTGLLLGASLLTFGRQGDVNYDWAGMIKTNQHMNTSSITSDDNGNIFVGAFNLKGNTDFDLGSGTNRVNIGDGSGVMSYTSDRSLRWAKAFTTVSRVTNVTVAQNGEVIVTGIFQGSLGSSEGVHLTGTAGKWNGFVVKLSDVDGTYISGTALATGADTWIRGVEVDTNGDIYITGESAATIALDPFALDLESTTTSAANAGFTVKYNSSLSYQWGVENYSTAQITNRSIAQDDNFVYVVGDHSPGTVNVASLGGQNVFTQTSTKINGHIIMINKSDGTPVHLENIVASETNGTCRVRDVEIAKDGDIMIAGGYIAKMTIDNQVIGGNTSHQRGFITKLNKDVNNTADELTHNWTNTIYDGSEDKFSNPIFDIGISPIDGSIYAARGVRFGARMRLFKDGGNEDEVTIYSTSTNTNTDAHGVYLDKDANLITYARFGNTSVSLAANSHITNDGSLLLGGWFRAATDFDPGAGTANLDGGSSHNSIFLSKLNYVSPSTRIYVDAEKSGNGGSWDKAYSQISQAISVAETGDTILVANGTYDAVNINKDIKLWGGYDGSEMDLMQRNPKMNEAIIDGNDNAIHVVNVTSPNVVIDGFTITGGNQPYSAIPEERNGNGLYYERTDGGGSLVIRNCDIKDNTGFTEGGGFEVRVKGDGVYDLTVENTKIRNNSSRYAPSWIAVAHDNSELNIKFANNLVADNFTVDHPNNWTGFKGSGGGLISASDNSNVTTNIVNCTFAGNTYNGSRSDAGTTALIAASRKTGGTANFNLNIYNSIFYGNESTMPLDFWANGSNEEVNNLIMRNNITEVTIANDYALSNTSITENSNNDPMYVDADNGDYTLAAGSPAIDAGDDTNIEAMVGNADLGGRIRVAGATVDLGAYEANSVMVNITDLAEASISVYPNPATSSITVDTDVVSVTILNANGQEVASSTESTIDVSDLATGLYFLQIQTEEGIHTAKITKQ